MSRSRRRTPIHGITTARSEKYDKRLANRRYRAVVRDRLSHRSEIMPRLREVSDVWCFEKDGRRYDPNMNMRK